MVTERAVGTGYFLFSLDTEFAWGYFDCLDSDLIAAIAQDERRAIDRLLPILEEFNIVATWALVGHLFHERCRDCEVCPVMDWKGRYSSFDRIYATGDPLWYAKDVIDRILAQKCAHEIAFHGYTHRIFDHSSMTRDEARTEIEEWLRAAAPGKIVPRTVIFPRNRVAFLELFREHGFVCYRGEEPRGRLYSCPLIGRALRRYYRDLSACCIPPVYEARIDASGLVNLPSSRWLFGVNRSWERVLDAVNLHTVRIRRMVEGVDKAAREKKILHIWAHPHEFQTQKDFEKLRYLLGHVCDQVRKGNLKSVTMADLAQMTLVNTA